jgi:small conductance mechanosensitive channel
MENLVVKVQEWIAFYGFKIIAALVIFIAGRWVAQAVQGLIVRILARKNVDTTIVSFVVHLSYLALLTFVVIAALAQLGIQTTSFIAVIGAAGLAIGLALQGSLANFAAGFLMIIFKPFKAGDYIAVMRGSSRILNPRSSSRSSPTAAWSSRSGRGCRAPITGVCTSMSSRR